MNLNTSRKLNSMKIGAVVTRSEKYEIMLETKTTEIGHVKGFYANMVLVDWGNRETVPEYLSDIRTLTEKIQEQESLNKE